MNILGGKRKKPQPFIKQDFSNFEGYFLHPEIAEDIFVTNFEYTASGLNHTDTSHIGFIAFTEKRFAESLGVKRSWPDGNNVVKRNPEKFEVLITETPIEELKDQLPQFIVPDTWKFMYQVGNYLRNNTDIPLIAITGSVGKTSTRMMIEHLLREDYSVLANRANHNTRFAIPLYMTRMVQSPDLVNLEVSLNALNNRDIGPQTLFIKPTISVLTSISYAHMSTMTDLNGLAELKANVFKGLEKEGIAIINRDIQQEQYELAVQAAKEQTDHILTYSMWDTNADLHLLAMKELKNFTEVTISYKSNYYTYYLSLSSPGMVENSLAAILVLGTMGVDIDRYLPRFSTFQSLPNVMERRRGYIDQKKVEIFDDTHNAAIPSMINAIKSFTNKVPYYNGKKLLVLGQVADLGRYSKELHESLIPYINNSGADMLLAYGEAMKEVVVNTSIPSIWYEDLNSYLSAIREQITENSLIQLKGSASGSDYKKISGLLKELLEDSRD